MDLARYLLDQAEIFTRSSGYLARSKKMGTNLARGDIGERRRRQTYMSKKNGDEYIYIYIYRHVA